MTRQQDQAIAKAYKLFAEKWSAYYQERTAYEQAGGDPGKARDATKQTWDAYIKARTAYASMRRRKERVMALETDPRAALDQAARLLDYAVAALYAQDSLEAADIQRENKLLEDLDAFFFSGPAISFDHQDNHWIVAPARWEQLRARVHAELVEHGLRKPEEKVGTP